MTIEHIHLGSASGRGTCEQFDIDATPALKQGFLNSGSAKEPLRYTCTIRGLTASGAVIRDANTSFSVAIPFIVVHSTDFQVLMKCSAWAVVKALGTSYSNSNRIMSVATDKAFEKGGPFGGDSRIEFALSYDTGKTFVQGVVGGSWSGASSENPVTPWRSEDVYIRCRKVGDNVYMNMWPTTIAEPAERSPYVIVSPALRHNTWVVSGAFESFDVFRNGILAACVDDQGVTPIPLSELDKCNSLVSGVVYNPDNTPANNAIVVVSSETGGSVLAQTTTNTVGVFTCVLKYTPVGTPVTITAMSGNTDVAGLQPASVAHVISTSATKANPQTYYQPLLP